VAIPREHLEFALKNLSKLDPETKKGLQEALAAYEEAQKIASAKVHFLSFAPLVWPGFREGPHHAIMAEAFDRVASGTLKRLIINVPPRFGKSQLASWLLPAWLLGRNPASKIITATHTAEFSHRFGRMVRNLIQNADYQKIFPAVSLRPDSKAAGRWDVTGGGEYFAVGVGGGVTGRGADLLIIDDAHSEEAGMVGSPDYFNNVFEWYTSGPRQRLQPGGSIVIVMTRWHKLDLTGQILRAAKAREGSDQWEVIQLPAILPNGESLWPWFWPVKELERLKAELPVTKWEAQYQQNPVSEAGALVKREWWNLWEDSKNPPKCTYVIQSWDTSYSKHDKADFSCCTTWGVFYQPDEKGLDRANIILLDCLNERIEFPELKKRALQLFQLYKPDSVIIESKAAGAPLAQELRAMGIPLQTYSPQRGNDKITRVNSISDIFASGLVWAPKTRWAEEAIEQFASFPSGEHDDIVDAGTYALMRFRQGGFIRLPSDEEDPLAGMTTLSRIRNQEAYY